MTYSPVQGRPRTALSVVLGVVALALSLVGLVGSTPVAHASGVVAMDGRGAELSQAVTLAAGVYQVELTYSDNNGSGPTNFVAALKGSATNLNVPLTDDVAADNSTRTNVALSTATTLWIDVTVADQDARWKASLTKLTEPTTAVSSLSTSGTSWSPSSLYRLKAGTYVVTTTYSGNENPGATSRFGMNLNNKDGRGHSLVNVDAPAGTVTRPVVITTEGVHWFAASAASSAHWSIKVTPQVTSSSTPRISGTAKVRRTLKAVPGTWKPSGVKLSYRWYRGSSKISGATKSSYRLTSKDKGKTIKVTVTGTKTGYVSIVKTSKATIKVKS